jgi:hypothetical protein
MNSRRRIPESSPWIREAYRGEGCEGSVVRAGADVRCTALVCRWPEPEANPRRRPGPLSLMSFVKHCGHG